MSFSITNNSATAVVTSISTASSTYGTFSVTSGSFPLLSGQTVSGTNTLISNLKGSPYGTIQLFIDQGDAQLEVYINSVLYSALAYSSGIASIQVPILQVGDTIAINVDEADLPVPSATPSATPTNTPSVTPTMTVTPTQTATATPTMTPTPSSTPIPPADPSALGATYWLDFTDQSSLNLNNLGGGSFTIESATDQIASVVFSAQTGSPGNIPFYEPTGFNGVSGCTYNANGNPIQNLSGDFTASTEWTFAAYIKDDGTQNGGKVWQMFDAVFNTAVKGGLRNDAITTYSWRGEADTTVAQIFGGWNVTPNTWVSVVVRVKTSGIQTDLSIFMDGVLQFQNLFSGTPVTIPDPIHAFVWDGGQDRMTECSFYDRALTNGEIAQLDAYLSNKY